MACCLETCRHCPSQFQLTAMRSYGIHMMATSEWTCKMILLIISQISERYLQMLFPTQYLVFSTKCKCQILSSYLPFDRPLNYVLKKCAKTFQSFLAATKQLYKWYFPSVCLSHLFDYVPIIASSWNFQELLPMTKVRSRSEVKGQGHRGHNPT